jgi:transcriptional regulator with XRE-family HTH domain
MQMKRTKLVEARLKRHWSQAEAAEAVGVDYLTLYRWEAGKSTPRGYNLRSLCEVYGLTAAELGLDGEVSQEQSDLKQHARIPDDREIEDSRVSIGGKTQAEQVLRAYVVSHRSDEDALRPLMELLEAQERYQEALEHYEYTKQALALDGYEPDARTRDIAEYVRTKQIGRKHAIASPLVRDTESGETVDRREAAKIISTFSLSLLVAPMALEQFLENVAPFDTAIKTFIDMRTVNSLGTITESHWQLVYGGVPKRDLLFGVQGHLQSVIHFLQCSPLTAIEQQLCSIASQQAQIMSEIYFDMHDYRRAEVFSKLAIEAAQKANNPALYAVALARMTFLYTYNHQFKEALSILQVARRYAEESTEITVYCWIAAMEAEVQANIFAYYNEIKASDACLSALERAECITERVGNDAYWTKFGPTSLAGYKGVCFKQLHKPLQAQIVLIEALNTISKDVPGGQATALTDLAGAYAQQGEIEEACNRATQALKIIAEQNKSVNILQRVCDFRLDLERWASSSHVRNLDEQIAMTRIHIA